MREARYRILKRHIDEKLSEIGMHISYIDMALDDAYDLFVGYTNKITLSDEYGVEEIYRFGTSKFGNILGDRLGVEIKCWRGYDESMMPSIFLEAVVDDGTELYNRSDNKFIRLVEEVREKLGRLGKYFR